MLGKLLMYFDEARASFSEREAIAEE